jgi:hypothetical protein
MDNESLVLLARFTFQARKLIGSIDSNLLANDVIYQNSIFQQIDAQADEDLLVLSMQLLSKLGMLPAPYPANKLKLILL